MRHRRDLQEALRDAADALRAVAERVCEDRDEDDRRGGRSDDEYRHGGRVESRGCFGSSPELSRLSRALLEAVEVVRDAATDRDRSDCDDGPLRDEPCEAAVAAPMPPYPPYPPYAPHAPFPPYPPYPPVVVIGGGGHGCGCQQGAQVAMMSPALAPAQATVTQVPPVVPSQPPAPQPSPPLGGASTPIGTITASPMLAAVSATGFPNPGGVNDVETLLDIGESTAALVHRTIANRPGGSG